MQHTFPDVEQSSTDNLLDYGNGIHLARWQWDWMREGHWLENIFAQQSPYLLNEESVETILMGSIEGTDRIPNPQGFYTPSGKYISSIDQEFKFTEIHYDFISGGVREFKYDGIQYKSLIFRYFSTGQNLFAGYINSEGIKQAKEYWAVQLEKEYSQAAVDQHILNITELYLFLKEHPEFIFKEFKWSLAGDNVLGNLFNPSNSEQSRVCSSEILQWKLPANKVTTGSITQFDSEGSFLCPLNGEPKVLTADELPKINGIIDAEPRTIGVAESSAMNSNNTELKEWYCRLITVYDKGGWGRFLLENIFKNNSIYYGMVKELFHENPDLLKLAVMKSEVLEEYGSRFIDEANIEWKHEKHNRLVQKLLSFGDSYTELENYLNSSQAYKTFLENKINRFKENVKNLNNSSDQDIVLEIVASLSLAEIELLDLDTRIEAIKTICSGALYQNYLFSNDESNARKIFMHVKDADAPTFLSRLVSETTKYGNQDVSLIYATTNRMNGTLDFFDSQYQQLILQLREYALIAANKHHQFILRNENDVSKLNFQNVKSVSQISFSTVGLDYGDLTINAKLKENGLLKVKRYLVKNVLEVVPAANEFIQFLDNQDNLLTNLYSDYVESKYKEILIQEEIEPEYYLHPFELVTVYFEDAELQSLYQLKEETEYVLPAIYLEFLRDQITDADNMRDIGYAIDIFSIVTGTYEFGVALRAGRAGMASLELLNILGSSADLVYEDLPPAAKNIVLAYQGILGVVNIKSLLSSQKNVQHLSKMAYKNELHLIPKDKIDDFVQKYHEGRHLLSGERADQADKMYFYFKKKGLVVEATSTIANNGIELKQHLDGITIIPNGVTYNEDLFRYITTGATYKVTDINPSMNPLENRFKVGLYTSRSKDGNIIEALPHGGTTGKTCYKISNVKIENLLDLTDENVLKTLGTSNEQMKLFGVENKYEYTHVIADWAKSRGYSGIKFFGAAGTNDVYENFIIFEQSTVNNMIINSNIELISW